MRLTVFGRALCTGCESTKLALRAAGIPFTYHDLDVPTMQELSDMAWFSLAPDGLVLPVLVVENEDASFYITSLERILSGVSGRECEE